MNIGARLRDAREARGLTLDALSKTTRVQPRILSAIEQNDPVPLPPRPYGRGFVRSFATEVGLDPDGTVRDFFSQFDVPPDFTDLTAGLQPNTRPPQETPSRHWLWPVSAVVAYAVVGAIVILVGRWAMETRGRENAVGTAGVISPAPTAAIGQPAAPPQPVAPPTPRATVALEAQRDVWVAATVDGERTVYRVLAAGERINLDGTRELTIRTGDAGALLWRVNGQPATPMGPSGDVVTVNVTPNGMQRVIRRPRQSPQPVPDAPKNDAAIVPK